MASASSDAIQMVLDERCAEGEDPATALRRGVFGVGSEAAKVIVQEAARLGISTAKRCRQRLDQVLAGQTLFLPWSPEETPASDLAAQLAGQHYETIERQTQTIQQLQSANMKAELDARP